MNVIEAIEWAADQLQDAGVAFGQGTDNAFDEAAWLVLWRLGLPLDSDLAGSESAMAEQTLSEEAEQEVRALVEQRIRTRQPAAYLTGEAWLQGVPFFVDARSIIPRSFIAELVAVGGIDPWLGEHTRQVLDLCTGNASLAVLAAMAWPDLELTATDVSPDALALAERNVIRHGLQERISLRQSDGLLALDGPPLGLFDLILCNPPYVNRRSMELLPPEFRAEPALALDGGPDGMDFIRPLLANVAAHLTNEGVLVLEIGHEREHFEAAFPNLSPVWLSTSGGDDHVLLFTRGDLVAESAT
jgi:ribosomal protein L3 glutamine methyltransferase